MKILKTIGSFFAKIWRWIKNTAWVQPLLIVGAIFGVIFSIPAITSGIQNAINNANTADKFYESFKKSLEGDTKSDAQKLFDNYYTYNEDKTKNPLPETEMKYFLMFTAHGNATAKDIKEGFEVLKNDWSRFIPQGVESKYPFKLYTIYTDEVTTSTKTNLSAFAQFMNNKSWFFEKASEVGQNSNYCINGHVSKTDLEKMGTADPDNFINPTIILVDWTNKNEGIKEVMFNVTGTNSWDKATLLSHCWYGTEEFAPK